MSHDTQAQGKPMPDLECLSIKVDHLEAVIASGLDAARSEALRLTKPLRLIHLLELAETMTQEVNADISAIAIGSRTVEGGAA